MYNLLVSYKFYNLMSEFNLAGYYKADIAFYKGFNLLKSAFRRDIIVHLIQAIILTTFIPIDIIIMSVGENAVPALAVGLASAMFSIIMVGYEYYFIFVRQSPLAYCLLARELLHVTNQPITEGSSQMSCTSEVVLDAPSFVMVTGVSQKAIEVYAKMAKNQLGVYIEERFNRIAWIDKIEIFTSLGCMITIIVLLGKSSSLNPAEIAVMVCFLVLQAFSKLQFMIGALLIAISPILCILLLFYICCCAKKQGESFFDKEAVKALPEDVIKCDGECAICLQDIKPGENIYKELPCSQKHIFHKGCLDNWTRVKLTCPTCRKDLPMKNRQARLVIVENSFGQVPRA